MVVEQVVTILLGTAAGVSAVLYAIKPRQAGGSGGSSVETIYLPSGLVSLSQYDTMPSRSSAVEAPVANFREFSTGSFSTMMADAAVEGSSDATIESFDVPARPGLASRSAILGSHALTARSHRAPGRSSASPRTNTKLRADRSHRYIRKR